MEEIVSPKYQRFTNLVQPEVISYVPCPIIPPPADRSTLGTTASQQSPKANDPLLVEQLHKLLQAADASYVRATGPHSGASKAASGAGALEQAVLRGNPNAFGAHATEHPKRQPVERSSTSGHGQVGMAEAPEMATAPQSTALQAVAPSVDQRNTGAVEGTTPRKDSFVRQAKRQRRTRDVQEVPMPAVPTWSGNINKVLSQFITRASRHLLGGDVDQGGNVAMEDDEEGSDIDADQSFVTWQGSMGQLRALGEDLEAARTVLRDADLRLLQGVVKILAKIITGGRGDCLGQDDREDFESYHSIMLALEAANVCLKIMAAPDIPKQIYNEDVIEAVIDNVKFNLTHNVLVFHDSRLRQIHRPTLFDSDDEAGGPKTSKKGRKSATKAKNGVPKVTKQVISIRGRVENCVHLLGQLLMAVQLPASMVLSLLRQASQALTVEGLEVLQVQVTGLLVAGFASYESQRASIIDELVTGVMPNLPVGKGKVVRNYMISSASTVGIMMFSALLLQLLQACIHLPETSTDPKALCDCFAPATYYADAFWCGVFDRLPARGSKNDTETDMRLLLDHILQDACTVLCLPDWPIAVTAVMRLITTLGSTKGLQSSDNSVRQLSVEMLGSLAARVFAEASQAESEDAYLKELLAEELGGPPVGDILKGDVFQQRLLEFLSEPRHAMTVLRKSAILFSLCRSFVDEIRSLQRDGGSDEEQSILLTKYRELEAVLERGTQVDLSEEEAVQLARAVVQSGPLGRGRFMLLKWLLDAADGMKQAPTTRAKAVKALSGVIHANPRIAELSVVQKAVNNALKDEAASVRQTAVDLLGLSIARDRKLAETYFDLLKGASRDTSSTSVRKAALKILYENCIRVAGSRYATEACVAVLQRVVDVEESMHDFVAKVAHELWFSGTCEEGRASRQSTIEERARQLAEVAKAMYFDAGTHIHLPLETSDPLIVVLRKALEREAKAAGQSVSLTGRHIAEALLEGVLRSFDATNGSASSAAFPYLVALHAFCLTDARLCVPSQDPGRFLRCLSPYLKVSSPEGLKDMQAEQRWSFEHREAEQLLCILAVLDAILFRLERLEEHIGADLVKDLRQLILMNPYPDVVGSACKALCSLAQLQSYAARPLSYLFSTYMEKLVGQQSASLEGQAGKLCGRYLYTIGHLYRYGADVLEVMPSQPGALCLTAEQCSDIIMDLFKNPTGNTKLRVNALHALGCVSIARPKLMLTERARELQKEVLQRNAVQEFKVRALNNLADLLKAEEQRLLQKQTDKAEDAGHGTSAADDAGSALATINGQEDVLILSSSVLQDQWDCILMLATDTCPVEPGGTPENSRNALVRRHAMNVIDAVYRNGLVAPWVAIPTLVAVTTDPCSDVAGKALKVLKRIAEKEKDMFQNGLPDGLAVAADFQQRLKQVFASSTSGDAGVSDGVMRGMDPLYTQLVQPNRAVRTSFLGKLLKKFDDACDLHSPQGAATADLKLLLLIAHVAACLPFKKGDEPLTLIFQVDAIVAKKGENVVATMRDTLNNAETKTLMAETKASLALSMLLLVKRYLRVAYGISSERIATFHPSQVDKRKVEERQMVQRDARVHLELSKLQLDAFEDHDRILGQFQLVKSLMKQDAAESIDKSALGATGDFLGERQQGDEGSGPLHGATPCMLNNLSGHERIGSKGSRGSRRGRGTSRGPKRNGSLKRKKMTPEDSDDEEHGGADTPRRSTNPTPRRLDLQMEEEG